MYKREPIEELSHETVKKIIMTVARVAAQCTIEKLHLTKTRISLSQAYRAYGRGTVTRWIDEGLIDPQSEPNTNKRHIPVSELEALLSCDEIFKHEIELGNMRAKEEREKMIIAKRNNRLGWDRDPY